MATQDPKRKSDQIRSVRRGMNSGQGPDTIGLEYLSFLVNGTVRGGFAKTRPGMKKLELDFGGNESLQDGLFQGAAYFKPRGGAAVLVASISGRLFKFDVSKFGNPVSDISVRTVVSGLPVFDYNVAQTRQVWMIQAKDWLIVQNALQRPIFHDGVKSRRAGPGEMKPGAMMEYVMGRIGVVRPNRTSLRFGDIIYGPSGTAQYEFRDAILKDTESEFLNEGGEFEAPLEAGQINAIRAVAVLDTSTGQGPAQVFTDGAVFSMNLPPDRTTWKDLNFPAQTASLIGNGALSQDGTINVNGDVWYRAKDGYRSFIVARRQFGEPGNTPMSREMNRVIEADDKRLLGFDSAILFDNRILRTASPANSFLHGVYHRGMVALDFDIVSSMSDRLSPAYDGLWTGIRVLKLLVGDFGGIERAFAFVLSSEDKIELWEISTSDLFDNRSRRIEMVCESPAFFDGEELLKLVGGRLSIAALSGRVTIDVKYRPDEYPGWLDWTSWSECANYQTCSLANCEAPKNLQPQYRQGMRLPDDPVAVCITEDNRPSNMAEHFQVRIAVTGSATIKKLKIHTYMQDEEPFGQCRGEGECIDSVVCQLPIFSYSAEA